MSFDPHPFGCPVCVAATPSQMREVLTALCLKLADIFRPSIHVINPSRGKSYPICSLHVSGEDKPRMVIFPGWEDDEESAKRRVNWGRQVTLLQRIADAGVRGETLQQYGASSRSGDFTDAYIVPIACTEAEMPGVLRDLDAFLGDLLILRVALVPDGTGSTVHLVGAYAANEPYPRLWFLPAWRGKAELPENRFPRHDLDTLASAVHKRKIVERPLADVLLRQEP
ncbi:MAG: hypothetical protein H0V89_05265 [Deltaproteobacteria bacterium]|nr:hypothetical protein [Deltaproteobacteria bacterium]